jgi:hypothetical protein
MSKYFNVGVEYIVYGIEAQTDVIYYIIFDGNHLLSIPAKMFEIIDDKIPDTWKAKYVDDELTLYPELFYRDYFFDRFSDYDDDLRGEFEKLR